MQIFSIFASIGSSSEYVLRKSDGWPAASTTASASAAPPSPPRSKPSFSSAACAPYSSARRRQAMAPYVVDEQSGFYVGRELKLPRSG